MEIPLLKELVVIFLLSIVVISACHRIRIPSIVAFLITGIVCGPYGFGLVNAVHEVEILAEIGVVLLLFSIGMELSISELIRLRKPVFIGGTAQVLLTILVFWGISVAYGTSSYEGIFAGFLVALSSTAIVLKLLQQKAQMDSPHGRMSLSILIYQDLVIVPMMLAIPFLAGTNNESPSWDLLLTGLRTLGIIAAIFLLARKAVPWILRRIVRTRSRELFLITTLGICLSIAFLTSKMGLSLSLGAFLAGLIMSESEYSHSALEGVMPFKDVFTSLFFISVGMLLNTQFFFNHLIEVGSLILVVLVVKALIIIVVVKLLGYPLRPAILSGLALCQIGEFSFVLAKAGLDQGLITNEAYQVFLDSSIMTMVITPFLIAGSPAIAGFFSRILSGKAPQETENDACLQGGSSCNQLEDHLVIIGFGIGGKHLARAAKMAGIQYHILEMNPDTVRAYSQKGEPIYHGDATHHAVLEFLRVKHARILAIVISDPTAVRSITATARRMAPNLHILVRTRFLNEVMPLKELGASDVIPEEFETSIEIFTRVLARYLVPRKDIEHLVNDIRSENYDMLRRLDTTMASLNTLAQQLEQIEINAITVEEGSALVGKSLLEANLRQQAGINVVAVKRGAEVEANPSADFRLESGDIAYVLGEQSQIMSATPIFMGN